MTLFSTSTLATVLTVGYIVSAGFNFYRLMHPITTIDLSQYAEKDMVHPLWKQGERLYLRVYLSTRPRFTLDFLKAGMEDEEQEIQDVALLWDETVDVPSLSQSFLLTTTDSTNDPSYQFASNMLDQAEHRAVERGEGGILGVVSSAGQGIESTSILLSAYQSISSTLWSGLAALSLVEPAETKEPRKALRERKTVVLPRVSPIWHQIQSNSTVHVHVLVMRADVVSGPWPPATSQDLHAALVATSSSHSLLRDSVSMVKFDIPHHVHKPSRILYHDVVYLWRKYFMHSVGDDERAPWDFAYPKPEAFQAYEAAMRMKERRATYPYWKPEVAVKYVVDDVSYPLDYVHLSDMPIVQFRHYSKDHPTGYSYTGNIHVDEIGLTSDRYIPVNETVTSLPLRISFHRSDMEDTSTTATTATAGGISPARWRLLSRLSAGIESQKKLGFEQSDIDDLRRLIADTDILLLSITMLASALHLLFEFLTFKSEVSFWQSNTDLTGLSVRSLFLDVAGQTVILIYLIERESSLLITVPSAIGVCIGIWKCQRGSGLKFVRADRTRPVSWWNHIVRLSGYELRATRLEIKKPVDKKAEESSSDRLTRLTIESDRIATRTLGAVLLPLVLGYTLYSFVYEMHSGWFSWVVTSASSAVYALGFVLMTPQLFLNWKLKSVAHLPWRVLVYKSLNTFIDDLFSFIIRMPTMARISCFRDDVVFFIYLYQRWLYPVDRSRPVEGGGGTTATESKEATQTKKNQ